MKLKLISIAANNRKAWSRPEASTTIGNRLMAMVHRSRSVHLYIFNSLRRRNLSVMLSFTHVIVVVRQTSGTYNIILHCYSMRVAWFDDRFLRIGSIKTPPICGLRFVREWPKRDAPAAKSTGAVALVPTPTARRAVVAALRSSAAGDEGFECRKAAYYYS
jgi:hypothetical protein